MTGFLSESKLVSKKKTTGTKKCGGACKLNKTCLSPQMPVNGEGKCRVLIVAEAPGKEEDRRGVPLIGDAGKLLRKTLNSIGIDLDVDCRKTNACICRPPGNATPEYEEIEACRRFLLKEIKRTKPLIIIPLGSTAIQSVIGLDWTDKLGNIAKWVGWQIPSRRFNAWICPTYHPSYLLRNQDEALRTVFKDHLRKAFAFAREKLCPEWPPNEEKCIERITKKSWIKFEIEAAIENGWAVAFDYETTGLKPDWNKQEIISVSISGGGVQHCAFMLTDEIKPMWRKFLRSPIRKIAANIKFEERWSVAKFGTRVRNWHWDTMQAAHVLNNTPGTTSLAFQSFVRFGIPPYDKHIKPYFEAKGKDGLNKIKEIHPDDLLLYNGMDSLLEYRLAMIQMREFGYPWKGE